MGEGRAGVSGTAGAGGLTLAQAADHHGAYRWVERRLFELTGAWSAEATSPDARIHLDVVSGQHAWHAELWAARLPVLDGTDHDALTRPVGPVLGPLFDQLAEVQGSVARLAALCRVVLPRLLVTYELHRHRAAAAADAPALRALRLVHRDEVEEWQASEAILEELITGPDDAAAAAAVQARLEATVVALRAGSGLLTWADPGGAREPRGDRPDHGT